MYLFVRLGQDAYLQTLCEFTETQEEDPLSYQYASCISVIHMVKMGNYDLLAI